MNARIPSSEAPIGDDWALCLDVVMMWTTYGVNANCVAYKISFTFWISLHWIPFWLVIRTGMLEK